jgi:hypothetical protein
MARAQSDYAILLGSYTTSVGSTVEVYDSGWTKIIASTASPQLVGQYISPESPMGRELLTNAPTSIRTRVAVNAARVPRGMGGGGGGAGVTLSQVSQVVETFTPLVTSLVGEISGGRRNYQAVLAGQIARKEQTLLTTFDPVKRAQLQAEIDALRQQAGAYQQTLSAGIAPAGVPAGIPAVDPYAQTSGDYGTGGAIPQSTLLWIGAGVAAVIVLATLGGGKK